MDTFIIIWGIEGLVAVRFRERHTVAGYRKPEGEWGVVPSRFAGWQPDCLFSY